MVASFSSCSNGRVMDSIGSILGTNFAHQASDSSYLCSTPCNTSLKRAVQNNGASSNILCVRDNGSRSLNDQTRMIFEQYNIYGTSYSLHGVLILMGGLARLSCILFGFLMHVATDKI